MSRTACVFPGQGSQTVGMLKELAAEFPIVTETFAQASSVLGYDLWALVQEDTEGKLNQTEITQPALLAASVAIWRVIESKNLDVDYLAGHSLGEYSALVCAGVIRFEDAIKLVEARGQFMQSAVPAGSGAMYAIIGLGDAEIEEACQQTAIATGDVVAPVNYNSPGQVVIAGEAKAVEQAAAACKDAGAKRALPLAVSVPSHCELMRPAADQLAEMLESIQFNVPVIDVVNNVYVAVEKDPEAIKSALIRQLYCPVQWTKSIEYLASNGVEQVLEIGPGKVLTGLVKRINKTLSGAAVNTPLAVEEL